MKESMKINPEEIKPMFGTKMDFGTSKDTNFPSGRFWYQGAHHHEFNGDRQVNGWAGGTFEQGLCDPHDQRGGVAVITGVHGARSLPGTRGKSKVRCLLSLIHI